MKLILAAGLLAGLAGPALAGACSTEISALEPRLTEKGRETIAASSGGKEVASRREAQAEAATEKGTSPSALPKGPAPGSAETQATADVAKASGGGTGVMEARASLNRARELDKKGDEAGCMKAVSDAREQMDKS
ncbi:hypothetical protein VQ02_04790 [Methylobacterium variabile]|jgi:hypothetical protein|uniref:Uncharacterized protein n=1 Tax=Methylobacterium variabile TaxID=298794 RepID=A0A0J6T792_9HYPH|nr:hypothetical protein [Methylobacterium variabile]KMO41834.1 hypothetical protein VQ02_04790 [Methylobacterium variabile]